MASDNYTRAALFERPDSIPMSFCINGSCYQAYEHSFLFDQMEAHPYLFPGFVRPKEPFSPVFTHNNTTAYDYTDDFGCVWRTAVEGMTGTVIQHPLADWSAWERYTFPDPNVSNGLHKVNWAEEEKQIKRAKAEGKVTHGGLRHGYFFLQLDDLRGYENLLGDMADDEPRLHELIGKLEEFSMEIVKKYISFGVDVLSYPEDLGMQQGPMLSQAHFRKYIQPSYKRLMQPAIDAGAIIHMHSDGDIRTLLDDILLSGVRIVNLQDLVNDIHWIKEKLKGNYCIDLDVDRQRITPFGTPKDVESLIREEVTTLGSPQGGLMMVYGLYPGVPKENIVALMDAMEKYAFYFS